MSLGEVAEGALDLNTGSEYEHCYQLVEEEAYLGCLQEYLSEVAEEVKKEDQTVEYEVEDQAVEVAEHEDYFEILGDGSEAEMARDIATAGSWLEARARMWSSKFL